MVLSRNPISTSTKIGTMSSAGLTRPEVFAGSAAASEADGTPGTTSGTTSPTTNTTYSAMSNQVRLSPEVKGTRRHGRNRMVFGLAQKR